MGVGAEVGDRQNEDTGRDVVGAGDEAHLRTGQLEATLYGRCVHVVYSVYHETCKEMMMMMIIVVAVLMCLLAIFQLS